MKQVETESDTRLEYGWWGIGLEPWRPDVGTYGYYAHDDLPAAPALDDLAIMHFFELGGEELDGDFTDRVAGWARWLASDLSLRGLPTPKGLEAFYSDARNLLAIPSCTDCFFLLDEDVVEYEGGAVYPFYADSQWCVIWSLWVRPGMEPVVLAGDHPGEGAWEEYAPSVVSDSFAEFVWRWWMENTIWYRTAWDRAELEDERAITYVRHYEELAKNRG